METAGDPFLGASARRFRDVQPTFEVVSVYIYARRRYAGGGDGDDGAHNARVACDK